MRNPKKSNKKKKKAKKQVVEDGEAMDAEQEAAPPSVWRAGVDGVADGETLQYDPTAYDCLHQLTFEWPCLSFDVIKDRLGGPRAAFPHDVTVVAGTQAPIAKANYVALMRFSNLGQGEHGKQAGAESDDDLDESDEDEDPPQLHIVKVAHHGGINRVRSMPQEPGIVGTWGDTGLVQIWDTSAQLEQLAAIAADAEETSASVHLAPRHMHKHASEGYALDWSPVSAGRLASGDCTSAIHVWEPAPGGRWVVSQSYKGHSDSVEDIQWSPTELTVFASCSVDRSIRIWDTRDSSKSQLEMAAAHDADVNVISWNRLTSYTLASGGDDGGLRVWDLRHLSTFVANLAYHKGPVTSVEWSPHESTVLLTTSSDNTLAVWDLSLERDPEEEVSLAPASNAVAPVDLPPQLLFQHMGQNDMKEAHWHSQIPGMIASTAADGFNVFKAANIGSA